MQALDFSVRNQSLLGMIQFLPTLEILPKLMPTDKRLARNVEMRDEFASEQLKEHLESFDVDNPRDFIDAYFIAMSRKLQNQEHTTMEGIYVARSSILSCIMKSTELSDRCPS